MTITLNGTTGITTPGLTNTGTETLVDLTTTGNTTLGDATTDTLTVGVTGIVKDASGNVGIGTASPVAKLDVYGPSGVTSFTGTTRIGVSVQGGTSTNDYSGIDINQNNGNPRARMAAYSGGGGSYLSFGTSNNYGSGITNTAMTIDPSGNVGVGATTPSYKLDARGVVGFGDGANGAAYFNGGATAYAGLYLQYAGTTKGMIRGDGSGGDLVFSGTGTTEQMRLTSAAVLQFNSGYGSVATAYGCRAWVNFNGTGTIAIRASGNVTSLTDNGVGDYTVNFTTAMPDANYSAVFSASGVISSSTYGLAAGPVVWNTSSIRLRTTMSTTNYDGDVNGAIFR
jgi:hypothetical protein